MPYVTVILLRYRSDTTMLSCQDKHYLLLVFMLMTSFFTTKHTIANWHNAPHTHKHPQTYTNTHKLTLAKKHITQSPNPKAPSTKHKAQSTKQSQITMYKAHTNTPNTDKARTKNRSNTKSQNHIVTIVTFSRGRIQASYLLIC